MKQSIRIVPVDGKDRQQLKHIIPDKLREIYNEAEMLILCVQDSEENVLGTAVFRENAHYMELIWIYIEPEFRRMGFAKALVERMMSTIETSEYFLGMFADYESGKETDLDTLLMKMDFQREEQDWSSYSFYLSDTNGLHEFEKKNQDNLRIKGLSKISECTEAMKKRFSHTLYHSEETNPIEAPVAWENYDDDLSCIYIEEGEIEGVFLLETDAQRIHIAFAYAKDNPYVFPYMLGRSFAGALKKYAGQNPEITVTVFDDSTERLLQKLVPNAKTMVMTHAQKTIQRT